MTEAKAQETVQTRFLLLSDTHDRSPNNNQYAFRAPLPSSDVLLHAGDLTMIGGAPSYRKIVEWMKASDAELKIVIAGNHDIDLDGPYYRAHSGEEPEECERQIREAQEIWTGTEAQEAGIAYLEEGIRTFELSNGAKFTVYASPYQPEFCGWAFPYEHHVDRFNPTPPAAGVEPAENPVPSFPEIDILLTHGPPYSIMDETVRDENVGCKHLLRAVKRCRPRLHVFGHIHEGWGAERVKWGKEGTEMEMENEYVDVDMEKAKEERCVKLDLSQRGGRPLVWGEETAFVNAAIMNVKYRPANAPWVVDLDLPKREGS